MGKRSKLSLDEREEAILRLLRKEEPVAELSRRYQVSEQTLYRWRDEFLAAGREGLRGSRGKKDGSSREIEQLRRELNRRTQVIGELTMANDILKKLQAFPD